MLIVDRDGTFKRVLNRADVAIDGAAVRVAEAAGDLRAAEDGDAGTRNHPRDSVGDQTGKQFGTRAAEATAQLGKISDLGDELKPIGGLVPL